MVDAQNWRNKTEDKNLMTDSIWQTPLLETRPSECPEALPAVTSVGKTNPAVVPLHQRPKEVKAGLNCNLKDLLILEKEIPGNGLRVLAGQKGSLPKIF